MHTLKARRRFLSYSPEALFQCCSNSRVGHSSSRFSEQLMLNPEQAVSLMIERKIKKLPVIQDDRLVGLVTLTDILRFQPQLIRVYKSFSSDVVPPRLKKVFDYYLLLSPEPQVSVRKNVPFG